MSNELLATTTTGLTLYAVLLNGTGQAYNTATPGWEIIEADNWTDYDIALSESEAPGVYLGDMPAVVAGVYTYVVYSQEGESPAISDTVKGTGTLDWTGTAEAGVGVGVDVASISGDAGAADALEAMLDGTGGVNLDLAKVTITATGDDSAVQITGSGAGHGVKIVSGAAGQGLWLQSIAQYAAYLYGVQAGLYAYSTGASGYGIIGQAAGSGGHGMYLTGTGSGNGLRINAGVTAAALELVKAAGRYITAAAEAEISDAIWDELLAGHTVSGSTGAALTRASSGGGSITFTYTLTDADTSAPIADADVEVYSDVTMDTLVANGQTNSLGVVTFYLDTGTYYLKRIKSGYNFTNPDTEVVA